MADCDKKQIYIHIGTTKTGTSSLQNFMASNRQWLKERGVLYPDSQHAAHHPLAQSLIRDFTGSKSKHWQNFEGDHVTLWEAFRAEVKASDCSTIVLSSEYFPQLSNGKYQQHAKEMTDWLGQRFEDMDVRIVCYLRSLDKHLKSLYKQHLKVRMLTSTFAEDCTRRINTEHNSIFPHRALDLYTETFGSDNLILRKYARSELKNGNIVDDFLSLIGISSREGAIADSPRNPSLPDELIDTQRIVNGIIGSRKEAHRIARQMAMLTADPAAARPADGGRAIQDALQHEHNVLAERYGLDLGEVKNPFEGIEASTLQSRGEAVLLALLLKEVRSLRQEQSKRKPKDAAAAPNRWLRKSLRDFAGKFK